MQPDEQIVVGVAGNLLENHFDTDMKRAPIPTGLQSARYNFSSYFYASYAWYTVASPLEGWWRQLLHKSPVSPQLTYRQFSAFLGFLACVLVYFSAKEFLPREFSILAVLFTGVSPLLIQDSHYARPEGAVTAGAIALLWLTILIRRKCSSTRCFWAGLLVGLLAACKISLAPLILLPSLAITAFLRSKGPAERLLGWRAFRAELIGFLAGCVIGVPYGILHFRQYWEGWKFLKTQYSHPFPPFGPDPEAYCFGFIANYLIHTFGLPLIVIGIVGIFHLLRRRDFFLLTILAGPIAFYYLCFGFQESFFERNVSHLVPWGALLASVGCFEIYSWAKHIIGPLEWQIMAMVAVVVLCLWTPLGLSWRIAVRVFGGHSPTLTEKYQALLDKAYAGLPMFADELWDNQVLERMQQRLASSPEGYVIRLGDANGDLARHKIFTAKHVFNMKLLAVAPGPFADLPTCTLQMYHGENYSWYFVQSNLSLAR